MSIADMYEKAWRTIIRPFCIKHKLTSLGPSQQIVEGKTVVRADLQFLSVNNKNLSGFLSYSPDITQPDLIVYLHGNGGCKTDAIDLMKCVSRSEVAIAAFDFAGCGNSDEDYLTYGINECDDLRLFLNAIYKIITPKSLTVWGRSMGAVTAIMFAERYGDYLDALVLDGPFKSLSTIVERVSYETSRLPRPIINAFLYFVRRKVDSELGMDSSLFNLDYMNIFKRINPHISILFVYSNYDRIVPTAEVYEFYNSYEGIKQSFQIYQAHDQDRKESLFIEAIKWLKRTTKNKDSIQYRQNNFKQTANTVLHSGCC